MSRKKREAEPKFRTVKLGTIEVDTGRIIILDPCNADQIDFEVDAPFEGQMGRSIVGSSTGLGDGRYPVFARTISHPSVGLRTLEVVIKFDFDYCFADDPKVKKEIAKREKEFLREENAQR